MGFTIKIEVESDTTGLKPSQVHVSGDAIATQPWSLEEVISATGFEPLLVKIAEMFPDYDISVSAAGSLCYLCDERLATVKQGVFSICDKCASVVS
jgi:hypothetical protein